jgi:hypothetical protein
VARSSFHLIFTPGLPQGAISIETAYREDQDQGPETEISTHGMSSKACCD